MDRVVESWRHSKSLCWSAKLHVMRFSRLLTVIGNGLNVVKVMPESAIKFGAYEASKRAMSKVEGHGDAQKISGPARFMAGGIGGIVSQLFAYPLDTLCVSQLQNWIF